MTTTATKKKPVQKKSKKSSRSTDLNQDNYYDHETDWQYQSPTWFKKYLECEAEAQAELKGAYEPNQDLTPLLVGNYLHSYFESKEAHEAFVKRHEDQILAKSGKNKGKPKKEYAIADKMIACLESDPAFEELYQGDKETIVTGDIFGISWKGKLDCLNLERGYFIDLKTTRDIHSKFWNVKDKQYQSFVAEYNYQLQMWVYQQLVKQTFGVTCQPYIVAVSKSEVPDKAIISIPDYRMEEAKRQIEMRQARIEDVKNGLVKPKNCGSCDYCKQHKHLSNILSMDELIY